MQPDMENLKKKIQENRDIIDRIAVGLPGFSGYVEKTELYEADRIIREHMAERLQRMKVALNRSAGDALKQGRTDSLQDFESVDVMLERIYKKCRYAEYASGAGLSSVKINEDDQNRLLEYDWRMISCMDECESIAAQAGGAAQEKTAETINTLKHKLADFESSLDKRKYVILEVI